MGTKNILRQKYINYAYPSTPQFRNVHSADYQVSPSHDHLFGWELNLATTAHQREYILLATSPDTGHNLKFSCYEMHIIFT